MDILALAKAAEGRIIDIRRDLHSHPELSWQETRTTDTVAAELAALSIPYRRFAGHTGLVGTLRGTRAAGGKTLVMRADMDALPIAEQSGLPFTSQNAGVMHACGHDTHTAMLLGAARILSGLRDQFAGEVRLLFQPAEEVSSGADYCVSQGVMDGADAVFGLHIWGDFDAPHISIQDGSRMASCDNFKLTVRGVSAHGSAPQQGVDAVVAAAAIVLQVQAVVSRMNDPRVPLVVTIGEIRGGKRFNIIADTVEMVGTVRTHDPALRTQVEAQIRNVAEHTAAAYGASAEFAYEYLAAPVINDPALARLARAAATRLFGEGSLANIPPQMSSEDYAAYLAHAPGVFCFLGGRNEALGFAAANHNERFAIDESVLARGAALSAQFALDFLNA
jgi:amidohydrolase